jgi:hypothetical protein
MNTKLYWLLACCLPALNAWSQTNSKHSFDVDAGHISGGYYVEKIAINNATLPQIKIDSQLFANTQQKVSDSLIQSAQTISIAIGVERKQNYALLRVPAFRKNAKGGIEQLSHFSITLIEKPEHTHTTQNTMRITKTTSALANGTWQKLAIKSKGVYKIDYNFVRNILKQSGSINSANIKLLGNGGKMIDEANYNPAPDDLLENALDMHDGGDGIFDDGDYFLFYASGPIDWVKDSTNKQFYHRTNLYADSSYYFISFNNGSGIRMSNAPSASSPNATVTSYNEYALHENELVNLGMFGKTWWGESFGATGGFDNNQTFSFPFNNLNDTVYYKYQLGNASIAATGKFSVVLNGSLIGNHDNIPGISGQDGDNPVVAVSNSGLLVQASSAGLNFDISYTNYGTNGKAYLDFIEINTRRQLIINACNQLSFRDWNSVHPSAVAQFNIANANNNTKVWDVSNPILPLYINGTLSGTSYSFVQVANSLHEYICIDNIFLNPAYVGVVTNQNLHGIDQVDYIIVAHPEMMDAANKLADFHRNYSKLKVVTADVNQVYNEFASGASDIAAIRDFVRMFYKRAGTDPNLMPKYLLLLGQASYDYKNIIHNDVKIVPTFETAESINSSAGFCSDDFFAILDSSENISQGLPLMDIGVGRIPATSANEAMAVVDKIIRYKSNAALGVWRLNNIYIADKEDGGGNHLEDADQMYQTVSASSDLYRAQKVYIDNMNIIATPGGPRCPDANKIINDNIYKGAFLCNYSGHGSIYTLSSKRIVTQDDYNSWNNLYKMPIMITATCDFSRFDNPALQSAGEKIMLKGNGGAIALVTTTQVVYATYNRIFNTSYLNAQFTKTTNGWHTFGDAFQISKNYVMSTGDVINSRKFALLGDPAIVPNFPRYNVVTDSLQKINGDNAYATDTIQSLGSYRIKGSIRDDAGMVMNDFNGKVNVTFFDKAQIISVQTDNSGATFRKYSQQNNIIFKGNISVTNGTFSFDFITPKDINYEYGKGKISYYADNGNIDAAGTDTSYIVGGFAANAIIDEDAPIVRAFMNDSLFEDGGITGSNSVLYAIISDKSGINVSGNFIGHDLSAVLDDAIEAPYILNEYYETAANTYQKGYVNFPINNLSNGQHTLRIKAWDVFNNSGEGSVSFEVLDGKIMRINNLYSYPNPFRDITHFVFEHNHPNEALKTTIHIFNTSGNLVRKIEQTFTPSGSRTAELTWDGTGNAGEKLIPGIYTYRIRIATEKNIEDLGYQKVILIR